MLRLQVRHRVASRLCRDNFCRLCTSQLVGRRMDVMARGNSPIAAKEKKRSLGNRPPHSAEGVDLTLIRWMLSLTPAERLQVLQQSVQSLLRLRDGKAER